MRWLDRLHHPLRSMGSLPTTKKMKCQCVCNPRNAGKEKCINKTEKATKRGNCTFSAHNLLKSEIFFTWLSIKLCPPKPGFTDMIKTKSTTVNTERALLVNSSHFVHTNTKAYLPIISFLVWLMISTLNLPMA